MDFAYLNAVVKSSTVPPYDPWYSGGYLNYYYFGQFMVASLIRFTGIVPSVAYNLAVPWLFALTAGGVFSIVYGLAELTLRAKRVPPWSRRSPIYAGLLGVLFVLVVGNIDGLIQVFQGAVRVFFQDAAFGQFDFWRSSRMMAPDSLGHEITEFPFFTFLFADLHAHLIAIPVAITALAATSAAFLRIGRNRSKIETLVGLTVIGILVGSLRTINAWDFPTQLILTGIFLIGGQLLNSRRVFLEGLIIGVASTTFVIVVGYVVYLPFHASFELFNNGVVKSEFTTELWRYILINSIFVFLIISWFVFMLRERIYHAFTLVANPPMPGSGLRGWTWQVLMIILLAVVASLAVTGFAVVAFALMIGASVFAAGLVAHRSGISGSRYSLVSVVFVVMAMALAIGVDIFTVKDDIGRMNTVFKFYLQAWVLLGIASAYFLWVLADARKLSLSGVRLGRGVWLGLLTILVVGVMVYPILGTRDRSSTRFDMAGLGLDGMAYMESVTYQNDGTPLTLKYDLEAIEWMQENVEGSPVIIEGLTDLYRWGNRVSIYTGLPAVIGWDWHQRQQRVKYASSVSERRDEIDRFYDTPLRSSALKTLNKYQVKYVYIGELERAKYHSVGISKFKNMAADGLVQVYPPNGSDKETPVTIYKYVPIAHVSSGTTN